MQLSPADSKFVARRTYLTGRWPIAGTGLLLMLAGLAIWLWFDVPWLINPRDVMHAVEAGTIPDTTLALMAMLLPVVVLACLVFSVLFILLAWRGFANEQRLLEIIERLQVNSSP